MFKALDNLELYLKNDQNVALIGRHGVGKTAIVKKIFDKHFGNDWLYLSGATMDPFIDLVGVPLKAEDENGNPYLEFIRPKQLQNDQVKAIFCDEYNRAPKKVRNALLEVIQFKSIQGHKFNNLRMVWTSINPDEDRDYDVEPLDPAQKDRFQIHIELPYLLDADYFTDKYGKDLAESAVEWWNELDKEIRYQVSPRRLDYAIQVYKMKGAINDVLPKSCNIKKLLDNLKLGSIATRVDKLMKEKDASVLKKNIMEPNVSSYIKKNLKKPGYVASFTPYLPEELIVQEAPSNYEMCSFIKDNSNKYPTSLISALENMGCFKESDFRATFYLMNKEFPDMTYKANKRNKMKKVLATIPDISNVKIRQSDITSIQNLIKLTSDYMSTSNNYTVLKDDKVLNFIEKFANLETLNTAQSLGLDLTSNQVYGLKRQIYNFNYQKQQVASQAAAAQTFNNAAQGVQSAVQAAGQAIGGVVTVMTPQGPVSQTTTF